MMDPSNNHLWTAINRLSAILEKTMLKNYQVCAFKINGLINLKIFRVAEEYYVIEYDAHSTATGRSKRRAVICDLQNEEVTRLYNLCTHVYDDTLDLNKVSGPVFIDEIILMQRIVSDRSIIHNLDVQGDVNILVCLMEIHG